jgi:hypothetical protein
MYIRDNQGRFWRRDEILGYVLYDGVVTHQLAEGTPTHNFDGMQAKENEFRFAFGDEPIQVIRDKKGQLWTKDFWDNYVVYDPDYFGTVELPILDATFEDGFVATAKEFESNFDRFKNTKEVCFGTAAEMENNWPNNPNAVLNLLVDDPVLTGWFVIYLASREKFCEIEQILEALETYAD